MNFFIQKILAYRNAEMYRSSSISWNVEGQMSFTNRIPDYSENFGLDETYIFFFFSSLFFLLHKTTSNLIK